MMRQFLLFAHLDFTMSVFTFLSCTSKDCPFPSFVTASLKPLHFIQNRNFEFSAQFLISPANVLTIRSYFLAVIVLVLDESLYVFSTHCWNLERISASSAHADGYSAMAAFKERFKGSSASASSRRGRFGPSIVYGCEPKTKESTRLVICLLIVLLFSVLWKMKFELSQNMDLKELIDENFLKWWKFGWELI